MNVGIDFGTTNSSIAFQRSPRSAPECASVDQHINLPFDVVLRTAVLLDQFGRLIDNGVGAVAADPMSWVDPKTKVPRRVLQHIKPFLRTFRLREQWPEERTRIDFNFYDHLRQEPMVVTYTDVVESGDMACSREELMTAAAAVFRTLFNKTPSAVMQQRPQIVIGVPLIFPDYSKKRLLDIVVRSGVCGKDEPYREALRRVRFLPEPIAASLLYSMECEPPRGKSTGRVLIFDSGGGTLDLALIEFAVVEGEYRPVRQIALGSQVLAGRLFDECIERHGLDQYRDAVRKRNSGLANPDEVTSWQLSQAAESIKVALSTRVEYEELSLSGAGVRPRITRSAFERWCQPVLEKTEALVRSTVADMDAVDTVMMVGGSSLLPCVQQLIQRLFPDAQVISEDARQNGRGEGVERALTAVSKGLALYDDAVTRHGITPFAYGFWDTVSNEVVHAAPKWSTHSSERPVARLQVPRGADAITLTLVQELVSPERVLNVVNVPVSGQNGDRTHVLARVRTSEGSLYPDIELLDPGTLTISAELRMTDLSERVLRELIEHDDHALRWSGAAQISARDTSYPEVVTLRVGDDVVFRNRMADGSSVMQPGVINRIDKIADGFRYDEVGHWDLRSWRFYLQVTEHGVATFVPSLLTDIRLARRGTRNGRRIRETRQ
ncbi:MAG: Hsp70 family protein [Gemmatimonadota bacterium]